MDKIKEIIRTLGADDVREFRSFIHRQKKKKSRKDLDLFEFLLKNEADKPAIITKQIGVPNKEAYYAVRKRLLRHLTDFVVLKRMDDDPTASSSIMGSISLVRYLFSKKADELAWHYLIKVEALAESHEQFSLLNNIYLLQIRNIPSKYAPTLQQIIEKYKTNRTLLDEDERVQFAHGIIRQKLHERRIESKVINIRRTIHKTLLEYDLTEVVIKRPRLLYNIASIARSVAITIGDFRDFEPYIIEQYRSAKEGYGFPKHHHFYKLSLLYMIAHALYRNRKFAESKEWLSIYHDSILQYNRSHYNRFYPLYIMLLAAILVFEGELDEAIKMHETLIAETDFKLNIENKLTATLSLATYYSFKTDYNKTREILWGMPTDRTCEKNMGKEWLLKKSMIEMLAQYELGNDDIALNRIRAIERYFDDFIRRPKNIYVKQFISVIKAYMNNPNAIHADNFYEMTGGKIDLSAEKHHSTIDMSFYCWIKSKVFKQPFYEVLLDQINKDL